MITHQALEKYVAKNKHKFLHREKTVGASEIGQCARKTFYLKTQQFNRALPDSDYVDGWGATTRGNVFESKLWVPAMRLQYGDNLLYAGGKQKRFISGNLSATPDALIINQPKDALKHLGVADIGKSKSFVIDCKSIDPRIALNNAKPEHVYQLHVQLGMFRLLTSYQPDYGIVSYTNSSFFDDCAEFVVRYDQKIFDEAARRADRIMNAQEASELKPEGWISGGDECKYCAFQKSCRQLRGEGDDSGKTTLDKDSMKTLRKLVSDERGWHAIASNAEIEQRNRQYEIKELLRQKQLRKVVDDDLLVSWSNVVGRPAYDWPGIKAAATAAGIDLSPFERAGEPSDRLTITLRKAKKS